jgi:hypothetical protein
MRKTDFIGGSYAWECGGRKRDLRFRPGAWRSKTGIIDVGYKISNGRRF